MTLEMPVFGRWLVVLTFDRLVGRVEILYSAKVAGKKDFTIDSDFIFRGIGNPALPSASKISVILI
jgi:hypothetical protein